MAKTVSELGPEVSRQYAIGQQILEEQAGAWTQRGTVARAATVDSMVPAPPESISLLGLDQVRRPFAWFPAPEGFGTARISVFGTALAGSLGGTARINQLLESVEGLAISKRGTKGQPSVQDKNWVAAGLRQLHASSELHDEINVQTAEFLKG